MASVVVLAAALWLWSKQDGAEAGETSAKPASEAAPGTVVEPPRPFEAAPHAEPAPPPGFVRVPAGSFMMGSSRTKRGAGAARDRSIGDADPAAVGGGAGGDACGVVGGDGERAGALCGLR
ncbi:MAG: hypothetical protein R3F65_15925 [bacterium]